MSDITGDRYSNGTESHMSFTELDRQRLGEIHSAMMSLAPATNSQNLILKDICASSQSVEKAMTLIATAITELKTSLVKPATDKTAWIVLVAFLMFGLYMLIARGSDMSVDGNLRSGTVSLESRGAQSVFPQIPKEGVLVIPEGE